MFARARKSSLKGMRGRWPSCALRNGIRGRLLSESIALAEAHGSTVTLDEDFGRDLEEIINSHS
jgi:hypothetical protein